MSLEIYKLYNNQERSISQFEIVHEGVFGNVRIEPYIIKNTSSEFNYVNVIINIVNVNDQADFVFKVIKKETEPLEEEWNVDNNSFSIDSIENNTSNQNTQFKFWVRTYVAGNTSPQKYTDKIKFNLSYTLQG